MFLTSLAQIQFFVPYRESYLVGGAKVKNHKKIAIRYLRSWFILDFVSTFPYEFIANYALYGSPRPSTALLDQAAAGDQTVALKASSSMRLLRLLRIMRLLKLGRIWRASRVTSRLADSLERYISISYSARTLVFWTFLMLVLIHWFCCVWGLVGQEQGTQRTAELEAIRLATFEEAGSSARRALAVAKKKAAGSEDDGSGSINIDEIVNCAHGPRTCLSTCELNILAWYNGADFMYTSKQESWMCRAWAEGKVPADFVNQHADMYLYLLQGSGLITAPESVAEYITFFILSFLFLIVSNVFVGVVAAAQSEADPQTKEFKSRMDHLNHFLRDMRVPMALKQRTRDYFRFTRDLVRKQSYNDLYERFSPKLRGDVLCHISLRTLSAVPYFVGCERGLLNALASRLSHRGYAQGEPIDHNDQGQTLSIVTRGTAVRGGKPITLYQYWGEDMIVTSASLRDKRAAAALTYVEIVCLSRDDLLEELQHYPQSAHVVHIAAVSIAMNRAPVLIAKYLQARSLAPNNLFDAMKRLGSQTTEEDKEIQAMLKQINGSRPLRGFARELIHHGDETLKRRSSEAVEAMGDDPTKMLVDEEGNVVIGTGEELKLEDSDENDAVLKAVASLKVSLQKEMAVNRAQVHRELEDIKRVLSAVVTGGFPLKPGSSVAPNGSALTAYSPARQILLPKRRRRQRTTSTDANPTDGAAQPPPGRTNPAHRDDYKYEA